MQLALISDIHSNLEALRACLARARSLGADRYACLGDMLGYGADPAACLDVIMGLPGLRAIRGNHEQALISGSYEDLRNAIHEATDWTRARLNERQMEFIRGLPYTLEAYGVSLVHASLTAPAAWEYIYDEPQARACMDTATTRITFAGHTHIPRIYFETPRGEVREFSPEPDVAIALHHHGRYLINVGSVGQPRDGHQAACFAIYNSDTREVRFQRVAYDAASAAEKIERAGLPRRFAQRLLRGT